MLRTRMLWLCLSVFLFAGFAFGSSLPADPGVEIDDPLSCTPTAANTQTITAGQIDSFSAANGTCFGFQIAQSSATFNFIDLQVGAFFAPTSVSCFSPEYSCNVTNQDDGTVTDMFFTAFPPNPDCIEGCHPPPYNGGTFFVVDLNFQGQAAGWGTNTFYVRGSPTISTPADNPNLIQLASVPEPSMLLLLGVGAAFTRIKLRVRPN